MSITTPLTATSAGSAGTVSSTTVTDPGAIGTDDVVVVVFAIRRDRTITTPSGWSVLGPLSAGASDASGVSLYVFWQRGEPSTWSFSFSASTSGWAWGCDVLSGVDTGASPAYAVATSGSGTDASVEVAAQSGLASDSRVYAVMAYSDSGGAGATPTDYGAAPTGWTNRVEAYRGTVAQQGVQLAISDAATSTSEATWTLDQAPSNWASYSLAFAPASAATNASAGNAAGTGAASSATTAIQAAAGHASASGAAGSATPSTAPTAQVAAATGASGTPAASVAPSAQQASAVGAAYDATVDTGAAATNADAGHASATAAAGSPAPSIAPSAGHAAASGAAYTVAVAIAVTAGTTATGSAGTPQPAVAPTAQPALGTGQAGDPTGFVYAVAVVAAAVAVANAVTATIQAAAGHASASGAAGSATATTGPATVTVGAILLYRAPRPVTFTDPTAPTYRAPKPTRGAT